MDVNLEQALKIIEGTFETAKKLNLPPLTVVVLDRSGNPVAMERQDGATMFRFDVAMGKAWGAIGFSSSSRSLAKNAKGNPNFFLSLASTGKGKFLPQPGAVLIRDSRSNAILGSVGASGATGDQDESACAGGVRAAGFSPGTDIAASL
eukprot:CAMPEP_0201480358 /NCGR_PEP_ID=MMETSP0151_2-20130828/4838_1 /ASSEMBLY_ACC=CAM_ASM_000257 /TAXON_ID=200890 /ORGANISM="Paramoeba atlantica, Strain 621/1 / CCAP 1560/9" /LENGTH=148 /DNA_ID=CAMNT_0047862173 /DNA_START=420 /DNA_END=866 /DNA_ORIENTATION=+